MSMTDDIKTIPLEIAGIGIILYSPFGVKHIAEGEDYLSAHYTDEAHIQQHIQQGTLVGFGTCSPGEFIVRLFDGYPDDSTLNTHEFTLRLGIQVKDRTMCIRDLYDLMDWPADCPPGQMLELDDGYYHITLCSTTPDSGILGNQQDVLMYLNKLDAMPALAKRGIPELC